MLTPVMRLRTLALLGAGGVALYRMAQQLGVPDGVVPVQPFQLSRYLGRWYEIARIDHVYERGLTDTSADYRLLPGGQVQVTNRGYHPGARRWREVRARAQPVQGDDVAHLQVSFMWPVRASYVVFGVDDDYPHALVSGPDHDYLWLLARTPQIRATARASMLDTARAAGFDVGRLMWVDQRRNVARALPPR